MVQIYEKSSVEQKIFEKNVYLCSQNKNLKEKKWEK